MIDHFCCPERSITQGCLVIRVHEVDPAGSIGRLAGFRRELHRCSTAVRCCHGSLCAGWNRGRIDIEALRTVVAGLVVPAAADGRIVLAVDVRCRLRPEAFLLADLPLPVRRRCDRGAAPAATTLSATRRAARRMP